MTTKRVQFVEKTGKFDKYGNEELKFREIAEVEGILRDWYGFQDSEDGFTQRVIDWYCEETDDNLLKRAKKIVDYVNERHGDEWVSVTVEEWLILEHTKWLLVMGERDNEERKRLERENSELRLELKRK